MKKRWKTIALGMGVSLAVYLLLPLLSAYLMLRGSVKDGAAFACAAVSAGLGAAVGATIIRRRACTLPPVCMALFAGPAVQLLSALIGFFAYSNGFAAGEKRWMLLPLSFACALIGAMLIKPKGRKKRAKTAVVHRKHA